MHSSHVDQPNLRLLSSLMFLSGFAALIYEILWTRYFALSFGANMLAVSIVAASFMAGLALGSYLLGRIADRSDNLLKLYAQLEAAIAITALAFPLGLNLVSQINISLSQALPGSPFMGVAVKLLLSIGLLLVPTVCMGGTLPVVCRIFSAQRPGKMVGRFYAINTGGAVLGCLLTAFFLLPEFGMPLTSGLAISINLAIALTSLVLAKRVTPLRNEAPEPAGPDFHDNRIFLTVCVAVIGTLSLGFEILWTRVFLLFLGSTTYAFATILGVYLSGLTLGAAVYSLFLNRLRNQQWLFFLLVTGLGLSVLLPLPFYDHLAYLFQAGHELAQQRWPLLSASAFLIVASVLILPTALSGALFPLAVRLHALDQENVGRDIGRLLFWNTSGAVVGSLLVSLCLIPASGVLGSFRLLISLALLLAAIVGWHYRQHVPKCLILLPVATLVLFATSPFRWDPLLMNSGVYYYNQFIRAAGGLSKMIAESDPIVRQVEGLEATVALYENARGGRYFKVNGKIDGSSSTDLKTQILLGQLPMLLHTAPRDVLVIGLGTGITLDQVAHYPETTVDCVEISSAVVDISKAFARENRNVLQQPNVSLYIQDGRNLLLTREKRYDVIVSEPSNPWQAGNANLFTHEFYRLVAQRLTPEGVFCQWLPMYDMPTGSLRTAINTFLQTFPDTLAFGVGVDIILVGRTDAVASDSLMALQASLPAPAQDILLFAPDTRSLFRRFYFGDRSVLSSFASGAPLNSDTHPRLEFDRQMGLDRRETNYTALMSARQAVEPIRFPFTFR